MPKLPRNMVKRGGVFYFRKMEGGRLRRVSLGADYEEACRRLRSLKTEGCSETSESLADTARRWLSSYVQTSRRKDDWALAEQRVRDYLVPQLGHLQVRRVSSEHVRRYRASLERTHLSAQSVRHILSDLRCLLNWCVDSGLLVHSPFPRRVLPKIQERAPDRISDEDAEKLCALKGPVGFVCRLGLATGLRWGEMARASASDVSGSFLVVQRTKSGKVRRVPLPDFLLAEIRLHVGKLVPFSSADWFAHQVRKLTGIESFHAHQMRHTFGCKWVAARGSLAALQEILGHASIVTTQRYARLAERHVEDEARRIQGQLVTGVVTATLRQSG